MVTVPVETVIDMGAFVVGNIAGDFVVNQCALAGYTWLSPDPTTSGRYTSVLAGAGVAAAGVLTMMYGPSNVRYPGEVAGCAGIGIMSKGVADLLLHPVVSAAAVRGVAAAPQRLQVATPITQPTVMSIKT